MFPLISRRQALTDATGRLRASGCLDARLDCEWMLSSAVGEDRLPLLLSLDEPLSEEETERFRGMLAMRETGEPLQYVLGEAAFMGHLFKVDSRVLIPRCDTETLCEQAIARLAPGKRVLDVGTGSGALAVSMALYEHAADVTGVDISEDALAVAKVNAGALGARVRFLASDLFAALSGERFDVIVSNPPYIPAGDMMGLQREVRREPRLALNGGADGLSFYRRILAALSSHLNPGGVLLLEVGDGQAPVVSGWMKGHFDKIRTVRDLKGLDRVVAGDGYAG